MASGCAFGSRRFLRAALATNGNRARRAAMVMRVRHDHSFSRLSSAAFLVALLIFILCAVGFGQTTQSSENLIRRPETASSTAPAGGAKPQAGLEISRVVGSLVLVIALICATRWVLKRVAPGAVESN